MLPMTIPAIPPPEMVEGQSLEDVCWRVWRMFVGACCVCLSEVSFAVRRCCGWWVGNGCACVVYPRFGPRGRVVGSVGTDIGFVLLTMVLD